MSTAKVEPQTMTRESIPSTKEYNDNGCPCECCGKPPLPPSNVSDQIKACGGKALTLKDGRVIEYFTYGASQSSATTTLIQIPGSGSSGWLFSQLDPLDQVGKDLNVRIISVTPSGHGLSGNVKYIKGGRVIANWPKEDLEPILEKESVEFPIMVEGSSYGTALAMATAFYFGPEKVSKLHLHVPYLPFESGHKGTEAFSLPDYQIYGSPILSGPSFCFNSTMCLCLPFMQNSAVDKLMDEKTIVLKDSKKLSKLMIDDIRRTTLYGALMNASVSHNTHWGFNPLDIKVEKVMVSYNTDDVDVPPKHGEIIATHFKQALGEENCKVNVDKGLGHLSQIGSLVNGDFVRQMLEL